VYAARITLVDQPARNLVVKICALVSNMRVRSLEKLHSFTSAEVLMDLHVPTNVALFHRLLSGKTLSTSYAS
jgi:hypothetical protein